MSSFIGDQNKVYFVYESGTFATPNGGAQWIGQIQNHEVDDELNINQVRFVGGGDRDVDSFEPGPEDFTGTVEYYPQDWKMLYFAMGSCTDGGSPSPYTHDITAISSTQLNGITSGLKNPPISFTMADVQTSAGSSWRRLMQGCVVDSFEMSWDEGDFVTCTANYIAQTNTFSELAGSAVTASADRPYQWQDVQVQIPSGTVIQNVKAGTFSINNNTLAPHYSNGSINTDVPQWQNREYEFTVTKNGDDQSTRTFYNSYFRAGSTFNALLVVSESTGSQELFLTMSGCKLIDMGAPTGNQSEPNEQEITIVPQTVTGLVNDTIFKYKAF